MLERDDIRLSNDAIADYILDAQMAHKARKAWVQQ